MNRKVIVNDMNISNETNEILKLHKEKNHKITLNGITK